MTSKRTSTRRFKADAKAFFEEGRILDAKGDPAADCWLCHGRINYSVPPGTTDDSHELDHYYPVSRFPELQDDPAGWRHAHRSCNRKRGDGTRHNASLGDIVPDWF